MKSWWMTGRNKRQTNFDISVIIQPTQRVRQLNRGQPTSPPSLIAA